MPFRPGEQVSIRFTGDPDTAVFEFEGRAHTVANGGLRAQHDGSVRVVVDLPHAPGWYRYRFEAGKGKKQTVEEGTLRVVNTGPPPTLDEPAPPQQGASYSG